ncbi:glycosyl hydrolase family 18 [Pyrenophora seminiperda CCB06]|uniref:chitinase n=1 Tax=Pyrenophora seminiperda CCB06 TaxID=1302712 RepID=A0A3M7M1Z1_9PLEO|nr:glycosyl hydrolase family 18 [Pyrenophora seminiperda CCB06]
MRHRDCDAIWPGRLNLTGYTEVVLSFAVFNSTTFQVGMAHPGDEAVYEQFLKLHTGLYKGLAIGEWAKSNNNETSLAWSEMASSSENRGHFINSLRRFLSKWNFDKIEIHWEWPGASDAQNQVDLIFELRQALGSTFGISVVLPAQAEYLMNMDPRAMQDDVNWFTITTYDMHGSWDTPSQGIKPHTDLAEMDAALKLLWNAKLDPAKVLMGIANYGRGYTVADKKCDWYGCQVIGASKAGSCTKNAGLLSACEINRIIAQKNLKPQIIAGGAGVKEITWDDQWVGYDDHETLDMKLDLANKRCLGGTALWAIDLDHCDHQDGNAPQPSVIPVAPSPSPSASLVSPKPLPSNALSSTTSAQGSAPLFNTVSSSVQSPPAGSSGAFSSNLGSSAQGSLIATSLVSSSVVSSSAAASSGASVTSSVGSSIWFGTGSSSASASSTAALTTVVSSTVSSSGASTPLSSSSMPSITSDSRIVSWVSSVGESTTAWSPTTLSQSNSVPPLSSTMSPTNVLTTLPTSGSFSSTVAPSGNSSTSIVSWVSSIMNSTTMASLVSMNQSLILVTSSSTISNASKTGGGFIPIIPIIPWLPGGNSKTTDTKSLATTNPASTAPTNVASTAPTNVASTAPTNPASTAPTNPASTAPTNPASTAPTNPASTAPTKPVSSPEPTRSNMPTPRPSSIRGPDPSDDPDCVPNDCFLECAKWKLVTLLLMKQPFCPCVQKTCNPDHGTKPKPTSYPKPDPKCKLFGCGCGWMGLGFGLGCDGFDKDFEIPSPCGIFGCNPCQYFGCPVPGLEYGIIGFMGYCLGTKGCDPCPPEICSRPGCTIPGGCGPKPGPAPAPAPPIAPPPNAPPPNAPPPNRPDPENCNDNQRTVVTEKFVWCTEGYNVSALPTSEMGTSSTMITSVCVPWIDATVTVCRGAISGFDTTTTQTDTNTLTSGPRCSIGPLALDEDEGDNNLGGPPRRTSFGSMSGRPTATSTGTMSNNSTAISTGTGSNNSTATSMNPDSSTFTSTGLITSTNANSGTFTPTESRNQSSISASTDSGIFTSTLSGIFTSNSSSTESIASTTSTKSSISTSTSSSISMSTSTSISTSTSTSTSKSTSTSTSKSTSTSTPKSTTTSMTPTLTVPLPHTSSSPPPQPTGDMDWYGQWSVHIQQYMWDDYAEIHWTLYDPNGNHAGEHDQNGRGLHEIRDYIHTINRPPQHAMPFGINITVIDPYDLAKSRVNFEINKGVFNCDYMDNVQCRPYFTTETYIEDQPFAIQTCEDSCKANNAVAPLSKSDLWCEDLNTADWERMLMKGWKRDYHCGWKGFLGKW